MELRDVMTPNPTICPSDTTARDAAAMMRDQDIGNVLVQDDGGSLGIVTDRDIVTRAVADGRDPVRRPLGRDLHAGRQDGQRRHPGRRGDPH